VFGDDGGVVDEEEREADEVNNDVEDMAKYQKSGVQLA
jgi:hypothetical protein